MPQGNSSAQDAQTFSNSNRWSTRQLVTMALMCAIGVLLSFIETPALFGTPFLKLDISTTPAMICGFAYGPFAGLVVGVIEAIIHGLMMADFAGALMNIMAVAGFVLPAAAIYQRHRSMKGALMGLAVGVLVSTIMAILADLVVVPLWWGIPFETMVAYIVPAFIPFNLIKGVLNAAITLAVYKSIKNLITPKKLQVKGR